MKVVRLLISFSFWAPTYVHVDRTPPRISNMVVCTSPLYSTSTVFPSEALLGKNEEIYSCVNNYKTSSNIKSLFYCAKTNNNIIILLYCSVILSSTVIVKQYRNALHYVYIDYNDKVILHCTYYTIIL